MRTVRTYLILSILLWSLLAGTTAWSKTPIDSWSLLEKAGLRLNSHDNKGAVEAADSVLQFSTSTVSRLKAIDILTKAYTELGYLNRADETYGIGLETFNDSEVFGSNPAANPDYSRFLFNYARFLLSAGQYDRCLATIEEVNFPIGSEEDLRLNGLVAAARMRKGEYDRALHILDHALRSAGNDVQERTLNVLLQNRGDIHLHQHDYARAAEDFSEALSHLEGKEREIVRANLALAQSGAGDTENALRSIDTAIQALKQLAGEKDPDYIIALRKKGEILKAAGRDREAAATFKQFFSLEKEMVLHQLPDMSPALRLNYWTKEKPLLSRCFLVGPNDPEFAMNVALMRRETSLLGSNIISNISDRLQFDTSKLRKNLGKGEAAVAFVSYPDADGLNRYAAVTLDSSGKTGFIELFDEELIYSPYQGNRSLYDFLISEDPAEKNRLYTDARLGNMMWSRILAQLPSTAKTIHFAPEGVFHLWGIENMPFDGKENYKLVRRFSLADMKGKPSGKKAGRSLFAGGLDYDDISSPAETSASENREVNSEAYNELKRNFNVKGSLFLFLPGTARETEACAPYVSGAHNLNYLTEEDFKAHSKDYSSIHLATHGYTLESGLTEGAVPLDSIGYDLTLIRSGIALTGANALAEQPGREDGILSAREICDLNLDGVDLVVLSACQTAKGVFSDESASGLIRALKMAGAGTIVASLWEVDDRSAVLFMENFYKALSEGRDKHSAFETARRLTAQNEAVRYKRKYDAGKMAGRRSDEMIVSQPFSNPWYWAPFILIDP